MHIIAGRFRHRTIEAPKGQETRPTASRLRETVFDIVQNTIQDAEFLDIFAGSGAMGIEALSRGAKHATFIENNRNAIRCLQKNLSQLNVLDQSTILTGDFLLELKKLQQSHKQFDIIFADAPYGMMHRDRDVSEVLIDGVAFHDLLKPDGRLLIENDQAKPPQLQQATLVLKNSRRSGKAFLHYYTKL